jgi:hypothetical protein
MPKYVFTIALFVCLSNSAFARDDGRYANDPLKYWFDHLASGKGMCCSFPDDFSVSDVDRDMRDGHYRVLLHGEWIEVPATALVTVPNRYGPAVVWPYMETRVTLTFGASCLGPVHKRSSSSQLNAWCF